MQNASKWTEPVHGSTNVLSESCFSAVGNITTKLILYTSITGLIITTLFGNILVIISIGYFKQLRSPTNYFVFSLAIADFLVGVTVMPYSMVRTIEGCWYFGTLFCKLHSSLDVMFCTASILHLSCIAFDRYYAVCNPLLYGYRMSPKRVSALICICWIVPVFISFGPILLGLHLLGIEHVLPDNVCIFIVNQIYSLCASLVAFYVPMLLMLVAYCKIYRAARKQALQIHAIERNVSTQNSSNNLSKKRIFSLKRERKAAKTLGVIMGFFLVFWTPFFTANIIDPFIGYKVGMIEWEVFLWLGYSNSALNPFMYGLFHKSFRRAFFMIIGCKTCISGSSANIDLSSTKQENTRHQINDLQ
ncbi:trace amine-associated receptor 1-like [Rhinophrynus dorsalis]